MIKIEVEKIVSDNGELGFKILKIEALTKSELPDLYLGKNKPYCYLAPESGAHYDELHIFKKRYSQFGYLVTHKFYTVKEFNERFDIIKQAGENLKKCNDKLKLLRNQWNGFDLFFV